MARLFGEAGALDGKLYFAILLSEQAAIEYWSSLLNIVLAHSESNPLKTLISHLMITLNFSKFGGIIFHQQEWDLEGCREFVDFIFGQGSWKFLAEDGKADEEWAKIQQLKWEMAPDCLRANQSRARLIFGWYRYSWVNRRSSSLRFVFLLKEACNITDYHFEEWMLAYGIWDLKHEDGCHCYDKFEDVRFLYMTEDDASEGEQDESMESDSLDMESETEDDLGYETADEGE